MLSLAGVARRSKQLHKDWLTCAVSFALPTNQIENINTLIQFWQNVCDQIVFLNVFYMRKVIS